MTTFASKIDNTEHVDPLVLAANRAVLSSPTAPAKGTTSLAQSGLIRRVQHLEIKGTLNSKKELSNLQKVGIAITTVVPKIFLEEVKTSVIVNLSAASVILKKCFWTAVAPFDGLVGALVTQPLADALALKTYTHGTSFFNYLNIRCNGADPRKGGNPTGSIGGFLVLQPGDGGMCENVKIAKEHFYFFKDISDIPNGPIDKCLVRNVLPTIHAILSEIGTWVSPDEKGSLALIKKIAGGMIGLCTPIISIRSNEEDSLNLEDDLDYVASEVSVAYRTREPIAASSIGLSGILRKGLSGNLWNRVKGSPMKAAIGALRLVVLGSAIWAYSSSSNK